MYEKCGTVADAPGSTHWCCILFDFKYVIVSHVSARDLVLEELN